MTNARTLLLGLLLAHMPVGSFQRSAGSSTGEELWVGSRLQSMTLREKIGQLFLVDCYPAQGEAHLERIKSLAMRYKPGGVVIMNGAPAATARFLDSLNRSARIPLFTAIDAEEGLGMRIDSLGRFPNAQSLGAIADDGLLYQLGRQIAGEMRERGFNMNLAPVADINLHPGNPVIGSRSFGDDKENVTRKALHFARGLAAGRVASVVKHFPGHGNTAGDSHTTLPVLRQTAAQMDTLDLYPFRELARQGVAAIMTGHLAVPALDPTGKPASLSAPLTSGILRNRYAYDGLIITDALNMEGVSMPAGKAELLALKAGNDMVMFSGDLPRAVAAIENAVASGSLTEKEIHEKCRRVLRLKYQLGLDTLSMVQKPVAENTAEADMLKRRLTEASLTLLRNWNLLPLTRLDTFRMATLALGAESGQPFQEMVSLYADADHFSLNREASPVEVAGIIGELKNYNLVIAGVHGLGSFPARNYRVSISQVDALSSLLRHTRVVILFFGNAYALRYFPGLEKADALVAAYQDNRLTQELSAQLVFGATGCSGRLPVTADSRFPTGSGLSAVPIKRLKYTIPEESGISSALLDFRIDSIIRSGLQAGAYPGCQLLAAVNGKVILNRCYGYLASDAKEPVKPCHLYDFASVTKVSGPLPALMKLTGEARLNVNRKMSDYWPPFRNSDKAQILVKEILAHQAGLPAVIPFWTSRLARDPELQKTVFKERPLNKNYLRISSRLYMDRKYVDTMYQEIRDIPLLKSRRYHYTCMGFLLWPPVIEKITRQSYESYLKENIYAPLGASSLTYNPANHFPVEQIAPTEADDYFRKETLRGYVHDEGAAMLGGISGNAGLFGTANDLAKLFQMYLWKGEYGGVRYIPAGIIDQFTSVQYPENDNRRGLGFDKPSLNNHERTEDEIYPCKSAGPDSFGHTGYTGTFVWADPENGLLLVFLSNRVHPTRNNHALYDLGIRNSLLQTLYDLCSQEDGNL